VKPAGCNQFAAIVQRRGEHLRRHASAATGLHLALTRHDEQARPALTTSLLPVKAITAAALAPTL
jgi:hypothetical protein